MSKFVHICLNVRLLVSYPSLNTMKTYFLLSFKVYKDLKKTFKLRTAIHLRLFN